MSELLAGTAPPALQNHSGFYIPVLPYIQTTTTTTRRWERSPLPRTTQRSLILVMKSQPGIQNPGCKTDPAAALRRCSGRDGLSSRPHSLHFLFPLSGARGPEPGAGERCAGGRLQIGRLHPGLRGGGRCGRSHGRRWMYRLVFKSPQREAQGAGGN